MNDQFLESEMNFVGDNWVITDIIRDNWMTT